MSCISFDITWGIVNYAFDRVCSDAVPQTGCCQGDQIKNTSVTALYFCVFWLELDHTKTFLLCACAWLFLFFFVWADWWLDFQHLCEKALHSWFPWSYGWFAAGDSTYHVSKSIAGQMVKIITLYSSLGHIMFLVLQYSLHLPPCTCLGKHLFHYYL